MPFKRIFEISEINTEKRMKIIYKEGTLKSVQEMD